MSFLVSERMNWMSPSLSWNSINKISSVFKLVVQNLQVTHEDLSPGVQNPIRVREAKQNQALQKNTSAHGN